jgi:hypothetical protein
VKRSSRLAAGLAVALLIGCSKDRTPPPIVPPPRPPPLAPADAEALFHVVELQVALAAPADQELPGLRDAHLKAMILSEVGKLPVVAGMAPAQPAAGAQTVGLHLTVAWQMLDPEGKPQPLHGEGDAHLWLAVQAHAERVPKKGPAPIAERRLDAPVPVPAERRADMAPFVMARVLLAARTAATDAFGELWARGLHDDQLAGALREGEPWRKTAAAREVGERSLHALRPAIEKLARSSRKDLAAVALGALGRLRDPAVLPLLRERAEDPQFEIADAALVALDDLGTPAAHAVLQELADDEERPPLVRARAKMLVEARAAFGQVPATPSAP